MTSTDPSGHDFPPEALASRITVDVRPPDRKAATAALARVMDRSRFQGGGGELQALLAARPDVKRFLEGVFSNSPHLTDLAGRDIARLVRLLGSDPATVMDALVADLDALRLVDEAGAPFLEAEVDAPDFPQRLVGRLPSRGTTAELNFSSWKPASPPETAFTLVIPPSATVTDVSLRRPE